jgi:aspartyl-tRNA(Asn)/glutamyl-tRNA(Gln) amidotransferase subunit B
LNWKELNEYFEDVVSEIDAWIVADGSGDRPKLIKLAANWCLQDFSALLNADLANPLESKVSAENMAELVKLIDSGKISGSAAKSVFKTMYEKGGEPDAIVEELGLAQVSDEGAIETVVDKVLAENEKAVTDFKAGNQKAFGSLVGAVMKEMAGKANPQIINELLKKKLS